MTAAAPIRIQVKLAPECGGTYQYTAGPVLLDKQLSPQPATGHAYSAVARGSGKPSAYGVQTVCAWLERGQGDDLGERPVDPGQRLTRLHHRRGPLRRRPPAAAQAGAPPIAAPRGARADPGCAL